MMYIIPNKALHLTTIPVRSIAAGEFVGSAIADHLDLILRSRHIQHSRANRFGLANSVHTFRGERTGRQLRNTESWPSPSGAGHATHL